MPNVKPVINDKGEVTYDLGDMKVTIDPKNDERLKAVDKAVSALIYNVDAEGNKSFKNGVTKKDVINVVHAETHKLFDSNFNIAAVEHHLLTKNGVECEFTKGTAATAKEHLQFGGVNHTWITLKGENQLVDPSVEGGEIPIKFIKNRDDYLAGKPISTVSYYGQQQFYSSTDNDRRISGQEKHEIMSTQQRDNSGIVVDGIRAPMTNDHLQASAQKNENSALNALEQLMSWAHNGFSSTNIDQIKATSNNNEYVQNSSVDVTAPMLYGKLIAKEVGSPA